MLVRRRVILATLTNWLSKVVTLAIRFFLTPFILHRLGETQFGLLALVGSVVGQGELLDLGIRSALTKYVAEHHPQGQYQDARQLIATSFLLYCGLGFVTLALAAAIAPVFPHLFNVPPSEQSTATTVVLLMGLQIALVLPGAAPGAVLWGLHRYALVNGLIMTSTVLSAVITFVVLVSGGGVVALVASGLPLTLAMLASGLYVLSRVAPELRFRWRDARAGLVRSVLSFSGAQFMIETAFNLQTKTDEVVIGAFMPISSVSPYTVARRLSGVAQMLAEQTVGALVPVASELEAAGGIDRLQTLYLVASRIILAVSAPLTLLLVALAGPLLALWVGPDYARYAPIVVVLALAGLAEVSHLPGNHILQGIARHHRLAGAYVCAAIANLGISVLLVRPYGLVGVALGTLIPSTILSVCYVWPFSARVLGVGWRDVLRQIFLPALLPIVPMAAVVYGAGWIVAPSGLIATGATAGIGLAVYGIVYLLFSAGQAERDLVRSVVDGLRGTLVRSKSG